jgi:hypothetical protein
LEQSLKGGFAKIAAGDPTRGLNSQGTKGKGCRISWKGDTTSPAIKFHEDCIHCVEESAQDTLEDKNPAQRMTSGAGHRYDDCLKKMFFPDMI